MGVAPLRVSRSISLDGSLHSFSVRDNKYNTKLLTLLLDGGGIVKNSYQLRMETIELPTSILF